MNIKPEWIKVQEGLYAEPHTFVVSGKVYTRYNLYSADGYCFYDINEQEEYPSYSDWAFTPYTSIDQINANIKSIPVREQKLPKEI